MLEKLTATGMLESLELRSLLSVADLPDQDISDSTTQETDFSKNEASWTDSVQYYLTDDGEIINIWNGIDNGLKWIKELQLAPCLSPWIGGSFQSLVQPLGDLIMASALSQKTEASYQKTQVALSEAPEGVAKFLAQEKLDEAKWNQWVGLSWIVADILQIGALAHLPGSQLSSDFALGIVTFNFTYGSLSSILNWVGHSGVRMGANESVTSFTEKIEAASETELLQDLSKFAQQIADQQAPWDQMVPILQSTLKAMSLWSVVYGVATGRHYPSLAYSTMTLGTFAYALNSYLYAYWPSDYIGPSDDAIDAYLTQLHQEYQMTKETLCEESPCQQLQSIEELQGPASTLLNQINAYTGSLGIDGLRLAQEGASLGSRNLLKTRLHL